MRPLEVAAQKAGVEILLEHRMTAHLPARRRVPGRCSASRSTTRARRSTSAPARRVIIGTGGSTGNVNFRRMFDPRLTEEYCGLAGMPWSDQDASGEIAAMAVGASLWGFFNQTGEFGSNVTKPGSIGCQYNYRNLHWMPGSQVFDRARATGLGWRTGRTSSWSTCWASGSMTRPAGNSSPTTTTRSIPTCRAAISTPRTSTYNPNNFLNAALAGIDDGHNGGGPIWAIFDSRRGRARGMGAEAAECRHRRRLLLQPPTRLADLAEKIVMKYQRVPMPPADLEETVARYNSFVDIGRRRGFRQAEAAVQDRQAAVLRRLGDAGACTTPAPGCASTPSARWST